jgi:murein L,D-transpeptidase YafK
MLLFSGALSAGEVWLLVDTSTRELRVMRDDSVETVFHGVSIGRGGVGWKGRAGDEITPKGRFQIRWVNKKSKFRLFLGLDYPRQIDAIRGLNAGIIDRRTYNRIMAALELDEVPPQNTALGGFLGIHGIGEGDPTVHAAYNWTEGCIALTNQQIDELLSWAPKGTRVLIR